MPRPSTSHALRPRPEALERRALLTAYLPAVADYDGDGVADISELRTDGTGTTEVSGRNALLMQLSQTGKFTGYEMGYAGNDTPTPADFDGDGKADPAVYGFLNAAAYETYYGTTTTPFPAGTGRFAYIPSSGTYPTHTTGAVNGTMGLSDAKVVVVNIGGAGDLPAVADYDGDGKADFAVYEPSKAQFLYDDSSTFNPNADPTLAANAPKVLKLGNVGDVPASADYLGIGHAQFAVYDAASGTFFVEQPNGTVLTHHLGGPGDIPVAADYEGFGHADYAVYDPKQGAFFVQPSDGSAVRMVSVGAVGDIPVPGKFGDGKVDFATYTPSTQQFQSIQFPGGIKTKSLLDPDAIGVERTDDYATALHAQYVARTSDPAVMFLGDSITYYWPYNGTASWQDQIAQDNPADNGVAYDTSQNLLWRIENGELAVHPRIVVLNVGTNDFVDRTPAQVAHTLRVIIDQIHAQSPGTSVLVMSLFPRGQDPASGSTATAASSFAATVANDVRDLDENYIPALAPPFAARSLSSYPSGDYSLNLRSVLSANPSDPNDYYANPSDYLDLLHPDAAGYALEAAALATPVRLLLHRQMVPGDYDGDGKTDVSAYLPSDGDLAYRPSTGGADVVEPFGIAGAGQSIPAPGDYDGDGKTDPAVYLPSLGDLAYRPSSGGADVVEPFGIAGAGQSIPAPGDYDGDGRTDLAVYLPALGDFAYRPSSDGPDVVEPFGIAGAGQSIPAPGDYDGDGKTDLAVYLPALGDFAYRPSSGGPDVIVPFGIAGAGQTIPMPGDYDGNGRTDLAVYLPATGVFVYRNSLTGQDVVRSFGAAGVGQSIPAPGDYDGDGKSDLALYEPAAAGLAVSLSNSGANQFIPFGIGGAGQSLPTTANPAVAPLAAAPAAATTATTTKTTTSKVATKAHPRATARIAQATPTGPVVG